MLIKGLPRTALVRTPESERGRDPWTAELELLAQLIEVTSVKVAGMRLRKPIKVPRPKKDNTAKAAASAGERVVAVSANEPNPYRAAIRAFGATRPSRLRAQDEGSGPRPVLGEPGLARRAFGTSLRTVRDEGREGT